MSLCKIVLVYTGTSSFQFLNIDHLINVIGIVSGKYNFKVASSYNN